MDFGDPKENLSRLVGNYILGPRIGSGSFADVWRSRHRQSGIEVAVKEIDKKHLTPKVSENLLKEISILSTIHHPNIIRLFEAIQTKDRIYLVLEYCDGGDLSAYIHRHGRVSEVVARHFMRQLAAGLKVLQDKHLIHRDLKPQNLLLATNEVTPLLKIGDFGFARSLTQGLADTLCGSPLYMAPEIIQNQKYDAKADLWSVGAILFQLVTGKPPFNGNNQLQLFQNILTSTELKFPEGALEAIHPDCVDLCRSLLRQNPVERLSFNEFFSHSFLGEPSPIVASEASSSIGTIDSVVEHFSTQTSESKSQFQMEYPVNSSVCDDTKLQVKDHQSSSTKSVHGGISNVALDNKKKLVYYGQHSSNQLQVSDSMESIEKDYVLVNAHCASMETFSYYLEPSIQDCSSTRVLSCAAIKNDPDTSAGKHKDLAANSIDGAESSQSCRPIQCSTSCASTILKEVQGLPILHPSTKLHLLHQYLQALSELSHDKAIWIMVNIGAAPPSCTILCSAFTRLICHAGLFLESFSIDLVVLALWKKAIQICSSWLSSAAENELPGSSLTSESTLVQKEAGSVSNREENVDFSNPSSVSTWAEQGFIAAFDCAEKLSHHFQDTDGGAEMPDAMELIFQKALDIGRSGAVDEHMENKSSAATSYSRAMLLLSFIVGEATSLPLNPPFSLTPHNKKRIQHYISNLQARQTNFLMLQPFEKPSPGRTK